MANRQIPEERKALYYLGMGLMIIGIALFGSVFVTAFRTFGNPAEMGGNMQSSMVRGFLGLVLIAAGSGLQRVGARGLAGSGVVLDPEQAQKDIEPWARMAGGLVKDAVDESGLSINRTEPAESASADFDQKLRKLHQLYQDGIITQAEFEKKKSEILNQ